MATLRFSLIHLVLLSLLGQRSIGQSPPPEPVQIGSMPQFVFDRHVVDNHWAIRYEKEIVRRVFHPPVKYEHNPLINADLYTFRATADAPEVEHSHDQQ